MRPIISSNQRHKSHHPLHEAGSSRIRLQRDHRPQSAQFGAKRRVRGLRRASSPVAQQYGASILLTLDLLSCS